MLSFLRPPTRPCARCAELERQVHQLQLDYTRAITLAEERAIQLQRFHQFREEPPPTGGFVSDFSPPEPEEEFTTAQSFHDRLNEVFGDGLSAAEAERRVRESVLASARDELQEIQKELSKL